MRGGIKMKGIQTLEELCRINYSIFDTQNWIDRAVEELKPYSEDGSRALAKLIKELLNCRSPEIPCVLMVAKQLESTPELIEAVRSITIASSLVIQPAYSRFAPEIIGGGKIGWTDGTASHIKNYASAVLEKLIKSKPAKQPDVTRGRKMGIFDLFKPNIVKMEKRKDVSGLIRALKNKDSYVRMRAVIALGKIGDKRAVEPLTQALNDINEFVREAAKEALDKIKQK